MDKRDKRNQRNDRKDKTMNTDEMIAVMQAHARGEAIEVSDRGKMTGAR